MTVRDPQSCDRSKEAMLQRQVRILTRALLFYAKGNHHHGFVGTGWDAPDEPNWMCPPIDEPTPEEWERMLLEDGGVAAAALRKAFGRVLSRYDYHTSRGRKAHQVCEQHRYPQPCQRCALLAERKRA